MTPTYACPCCDGRLELRRLRPDPHEPPVSRMVCNCCEYSEDVPVDVQGHAEDRPKLPGF